MEKYGNRPDWARYFPEESDKSMAVMAILSALIGAATTLLAVNVLEDYGVALFCGVPLVMGMIAPILHGIGARRTFLSLLGASIWAQIGLFCGILILGIDGIFCLFMAAPLWMTCAVVGTCIAYPIHRRMWRNYGLIRGFPVTGLLLVLSLPLWMGAEHLEGQESTLFVLTSSVEIDAPPEVVWNRVVSFPDLPPMGWSNGGWLFKAGIARPIRAEIEGSGVGATRYCIFSTGKAQEPVTAWIPGKLLEVNVITTPPPMVETSIYPNLHPAHLDGYFESVKARFELIDLGKGRTRLVGTSWYRNRLFPAAYWQLWSDAAVKAVQVNVLAHVKALSEADEKHEARHERDLQYLTGSVRNVILWPGVGHQVPPGLLIVGGMLPKLRRLP